MKPLRPVPDQPPRALLYLRQSTARDDSVSLELQETAGRDYCARMGYEVAGVESDPGISGRTFKRPAVTRVMQLVEAGDADVIVLWKWSRLSRSRRDWAIAADRVDVVGGRIESATESVDVSTAVGRLARGVLTEFAAFESERIGEVWTEVQQRRARAGLPHAGWVKWGYRRAEGGGIEPDPETGPVLAELYRRYLAGHGFQRLAQWLHERGIRGSAGAEFAPRSVSRVMDAGHGAGFVRYRGDLLPGSHEPVIDVKTWQAYLAKRRIRTSTPSRRLGSRYMLTGLVRCGRCGGPMYVQTGQGSGRPKMQCQTAREQRWRCAGGWVHVAVVEAAVMEWLSGLVADVDAAAATADVQRARRTTVASEAKAMAREVAAVDRALSRLTVQLAEGLVPDAAYATARDELAQRRERLASQLQAAEDQQKLEQMGARVTPALLRRWDSLPVERRAELLRQLIRRVEVLTGKPRAQISVVPVWEGLG